MAMIDVFLSPGWAVEAVPIVCSCGLAFPVCCSLPTWNDRSKNMLPMLLLIFFALAGSVIGLCLWHGENRWALAVMGDCGCSFLLAACARLRSAAISCGNCGGGFTQNKGGLGKGQWNCGYWA